MRQLACITLIVVWGGIAFGQVPIVGVEGATIADIEGTSTLVTVVLKDRGATDANLTIADVGPESISVMSDKGDRGAYLFSDIKEIRVQGGKVEEKVFRKAVSRELTADQRKLLDLGIARVREVFKSRAANQNQGLKMDAACLLAAKGDKAAIGYLQQLAKQDEMATALGASFRLYLSGGQQVDSTLVERALSSGNRSMRGQAARLAGLVGDAIAEPYLMNMVRDRGADLSVPAARALGRLGVKDALPHLLEMLGELSDEKGDAAVSAIKRLGGEETITQLHRMLKDSEGLMRYRVIRALYELGDPKGKELLKSESLKIHTLRLYAALPLAREGEMEARTVLKKYLAKRFDEKPSVVSMRAKAAASLYIGGDHTTTAELQDLLGLEFPDIKEPERGNRSRGIGLAVCQAITYLNNRAFMPMLQPVLLNPYPEVSVSATQALYGLSDADFRNRILAYWQLD